MIRTISFAAAQEVYDQLEIEREVRLFDSQWVNIVNHDDCYAFYSKDEAVEKAVRLTEEAMARNLQEGKWPTHRRV